MSILSIAHLDDAERQFFLTMLLNEVVAWVRSQPGTSSLRAILYIDEVFGYLPPTAMPPTKVPLLTLLKQARAFGLGVVLATQNPVDLDYKALSNTGTWFLGRLQTERDKERVLDGLEGTTAMSGEGGLSRKELDALLSDLESRAFLVNNVHEDRPVLIRTRWAMSYLRGPLARSEIKRLTATEDEAPEPLPRRPPAVRRDRWCLRVSTRYSSRLAAGPTDRCCSGTLSCTIPEPGSGSITGLKSIALHRSIRTSAPIRGANRRSWNRHPTRP